MFKPLNPILGLEAIIVIIGDRRYEGNGPGNFPRGQIRDGALTNGN
jgi:hypothetical protein